jgi:hypothetical protein
MVERLEREVWWGSELSCPAILTLPTRRRGFTWRLLRACLMSPSAVKMMASNPSGTYGTCVFTCMPLKHHSLPPRKYGIGHSSAWISITGMLEIPAWYEFMWTALTASLQWKQRSGEGSDMLNGPSMLARLGSMVKGSNPSPYAFNCCLYGPSIAECRKSSIDQRGTQ